MSVSRSVPGAAKLPAERPALEDEGAPAASTALLDPATGEPRRAPQPRQDVSVAFLPLALVAFIILAFIAATWTFLASSV